MCLLAKQDKRGQYSHTAPVFMSDFATILNAEIVESGRVPDIRVIERAKELADILEDYFSDRNTLTPVVSPSEDLITFENVTEEVGFKLFVSIDRNSRTLEDELIVWDKINNRSITIRGRLKAEDFEYAFKD